MLGVIAQVDFERRIGFVDVAGGGRYFFRKQHLRSLPWSRRLLFHPVEFEPGEHQGRLRARRVRPREDHYQERQNAFL